MIGTVACSRPLYSLGQIPMQSRSPVYEPPPVFMVRVSNFNEATLTASVQPTPVCLPAGHLWF